MDEDAEDCAKPLRPVTPAEFWDHVELTIRKGGKA